MTEQTPKFLRRRKMLLVLPVLVIPFITMAFWALEGGKKNDDKKTDTKQQGFNKKLPGTDLPDYRVDNKLSFYQEAEADSLKKKEELLNDPFFQDSLLAFDDSYSSTELSQKDYLNNGYENKYSGQMNLARNEQKIQKHIYELNKQINQASAADGPGNTAGDKIISKVTDKEFSRNVDRIENMMELMQDDKANDPELLELNGTLDKILDIQYPQRVINRTRQTSIEKKEEVFIAQKNHLASVSLLDTTADKSQNIENKFLSVWHDHEDIDQNMIEATIQESKSVADGSIIKIQLLDSVYISGRLIPKGHLIYGKTSLSGPRLEILISAVRIGKSVYPVKLKAYDLDGLTGLFIPGSVAAEVSQEEIDRGLNLDPLSSLNPSLKIQAASAGINTARKIVTKKIRQNKAFVKAGYKILLQNQQY